MRNEYTFECKTIEGYTPQQERVTSSTVMKTEDETLDELVCFFNRFLLAQGFAESSVKAELGLDKDELD